MARLLIGVDFTSAPSRHKPVVVAWGRAVGPVLKLEGWEGLADLDAFAAWLAAQPEWLGGFDLPFGLPRALVEAWGWPTDWAACQTRYAATPREVLREAFAAWCDARPAGDKFAHRACDRPAGSSPSMKWVNPPVAWMMHAGVPILRAAQAWLPAHEPRPTEDPPRIALEAYPGLLARAVVGRRSYKSDTPAQQTPERLIARREIVEALEQDRSPLGLRLKLSAAQRDRLADDPRGDALDAVLCLLQAAWSEGRPRFGLPEAVDPLEGWILSA